MKESRLKKRLRKIARWHALFSLSIFGLYVALSAVYSPEFLLSDIHDKFRALADDTITVTATVLDPPVKPVVTGSSVCNTGTGTLSVELDWADDVNSEYYDIDRDSLPLVSGILPSEYDDTAVALSTTYSYVVTARGPMGPGFAESDPVDVTTPSECEIAFTPTLSITSFDDRPIGSYSGIPAVSNRKPEFIGTTNIPNATIDILINASTVISATISANANGYWSWEPPINLTRGAHTLFLTATDPNDPSISVSENFLFRITKKKSEEGGGQVEEETILPSTPTGVSESREKPSGAPLDFTLSVGNTTIVQGDPLSVIMTMNRLDGEFDGMDAVVRYSVLDEKGNEKTSLLRDTALREGLVLRTDVPLQKFLKDGRYRVRAELIFESYNLSREIGFSVLPLPVLDLGGGSVMTYPELLSDIGMIASWLLFLLLFWLFLFSREYWLYLHSLRHITEWNLAKAGFFGNGKGVSR